MNTNEWDLTKIPENIEIPSKFPGVEYSLTPHYLRHPLHGIRQCGLKETERWGDKRRRVTRVSGHWRAAGAVARQAVAPPLSASGTTSSTTEAATAGMAAPGAPAAGMVRGVREGRWSPLALALLLMYTLWHQIHFHSVTSNLFTQRGLWSFTAKTASDCCRQPFLRLCT